MAELEAAGKTVLLVGETGAVPGAIAVADTLKPEAREGVDALRHEDVGVLLLTGDNERTDRAIARELGIGRVIAEVLPDDKAGVIRRLQDKAKWSRWSATESTTPQTSGSPWAPTRTWRRRPAPSS